MKRLSWSALAALLVIGVCAPSAEAQISKCQRSIAKSSAAFLQAKTKALTKCAGAAVKGGTDPGACPDAKATNSIDKAQAKLVASINKACGGSDKVCNADIIDEPAYFTLGWPFDCPNIGHETCNSPIRSCGDIATCISCIGGEAANESAGLSYDYLALPSTSNTALNKCQQAIGKATSAFLGAQSKAYQKCWDARINGKHSASCAPPATGDGKIIAAVNKARTKAISTITKACAGPDKTLGGGDDFTPAQIGFPATCPSATIPGVTPCGGAVTDLNGVITCSTCLAEVEANCTDRAQVPQFNADFGGYPAGCTACLSADPVGPCPTAIEFTADGPSVDLDTGWTGFGHDATVPTNGRLTLAVSGCAGGSQPTCGQCNVSGPNANAGGPEINNRRCQNAPWIECTLDAQCGAGTCIYFFGAPLPLVAGGVPTCVVNEVSGAVSGTINLTDGSSTTVVPLRSKVHPTGTVAEPCPNCVTGRTAFGCGDQPCCNAGPRTDQPCTTMGTGVFGDVSLDCPPDPGANAGTLVIALDISTGNQTTTLEGPTCHGGANDGAACDVASECPGGVCDGNPRCTQSGFDALCIGGANEDAACNTESECPGGQCGRRCFCDTCNNINAEACSSNADCPDPAGPTGPICGGKRCRQGSNNGAPCTLDSECPGGGLCGRPGEPTQPNACLDDPMTILDGTECQPTGGNEGECAEGPASQVCSIETFRTCSDNAGCVHVDAGGTCLDCKATGQNCVTKARPCFLDNGLIGGGVTVAGANEAPCGDSARPQVGTFFCVAPVSADAVNAAGGLPALGRARIPGRVLTLP